jgi:hypothetical protein
MQVKTPDRVQNLVRVAGIKRKKPRFRTAFFQLLWIASAPPRNDALCALSRPEKS